MASAAPSRHEPPSKARRGRVSQSRVTADRSKGHMGKHHRLVPMPMARREPAPRRFWRISVAGHQCHPGRGFSPLPIPWATAPRGLMGRASHRRESARQRDSHRNAPTDQAEDEEPPS
jgi:hypothetical protein